MANRIVVYIIPEHLPIVIKYKGEMVTSVEASGRSQMMIKVIPTGDKIGHHMSLDEMHPEELSSISMFPLSSAWPGSTREKIFDGPGWKDSHQGDDTQGKEEEQFC